MRRTIELRAGWFVVVLALVAGGIAAVLVGRPGEARGKPSEAPGGAASAVKAQRAGADWPMWGGAPGRNMVTLVTGPSRTADIERVLTVGVQGPGRVMILFGLDWVALI